MTAIVVIPYCPSPLRAGPFEQVKQHLATAPWPYTVAFDNRKPFRLAETVNEQVALTKTDIVILNFADTIAPIAQMEIAVDLAERAPGLVSAYTRYVRLNEDGSHGKVLADPSGHGCAAIRRSCWDDIGGFDEGYVGWGMEDRDFNRRAEKLWPRRSVPGDLFHFWHGDRRFDDSDLDTPAELVNENWRRFKATA